MTDSLLKRDTELRAQIVDSEDFNQKYDRVGQQMSYIHRVQLAFEPIGVPSKHFKNQERDSEDVLAEQLVQNERVIKELVRLKKFEDAFWKVIII